MPYKTKTKENTTKLKDTDKNQKVNQKPVTNTKNLKKDAERAARNINLANEGKKTKLGRNKCPDGMTWDADQSKCV